MKIEEPIKEKGDKYIYINMERIKERQENITLPIISDGSHA
jgi:hypothetical protein